MLHAAIWFTSGFSAPPALNWIVKLRIHLLSLFFITCLSQQSLAALEKTME